MKVEENYLNHDDKANSYHKLYNIVRGQNNIQFFMDFYTV